MTPGLEGFRIERPSVTSAKVDAVENSRLDYLIQARMTTCLVCVLGYSAVSASWLVSWIQSVQQLNIPGLRLAWRSAPVPATLYVPLRRGWVTPGSRTIWNFLPVAWASSPCSCQHGREAHATGDFVVS